MAKNLKDQPVTREMHEAYLRDPSDSRAMPYSTKQQAANAANVGRTTLYHPTLGPKTFERHELEGGIPDGWYDSPTLYPNDTEANDEGVDPEPPASAELEALRSECDRLGIKYHYRAGIEKLRKALLAA